MIAPDFALLVQCRPRALRAHRGWQPCHHPIYCDRTRDDFPWFPLCLNFVLLGVALFVCKTINASRGAPEWNGALIFVGFCLLAIVADLLLTLVFRVRGVTDRMRYVSLSSTSAWSERTCRRMRFRALSASCSPCAFGSASALRRLVADQTSDYTHSEMSL